MAIDVIRLVSGDDRPVVLLTLTDEITGVPYNLLPASTTVSVRFRTAGSQITLSTITCAKVSGGTTGQVQFSFVGGVLNVPPGMYEGEVVINEGGFVQTVYDILRFRVRERFRLPV